MMFDGGTLFAASELAGADYLVVLVYLAGVLIAGWYFSREQK